MSYFFAYLDSPVGDLTIIVSDTALIVLEFTDSPRADMFFKKYQPIHHDGHNLILQCRQELEEYFCGKRKTFTIPLEVEGTLFQKKAWNALQKIPYGETRNYKEEAVLVGNPKAVRAIGGANNKNPIVIIIPCHRVIGANGDLIGYGGGIDRKKSLLEHEKKWK